MANDDRNSRDHDGESSGYDELVMPVLLDLARRRYGRTIAAAVASSGYSDLPRRGARLIGGIARNGTIRQEDLPRAVGGTKQAVSQLIDTCVTRGYLERVPDPDDRRRMIISLTPRGEDAAAVVRSAVEGVDATLVAGVGADGVATLRRLLGELVDLEITPVVA